MVFFYPCGWMIDYMPRPRRASCPLLKRMAGAAGAGSHAKPNRRVTLLSYWWLPFVKPYRDNPFERETYDVAGGSSS